MSKLIHLFFKIKETLYLFSFLLLFVIKINSQENYSLQLVNIDTIKLNNYQIQFHLDNNKTLFIKSNEGKFFLNEDELKIIDSIKVFDKEDESNFWVYKGEYKFLNHSLLLKPFSVLDEVVVVGNSKPKIEIGIIEKAKRKTISNNEYSMIVEIPIDSNFIGKKIKSFNMYPAKAKNFITKEKIKINETEIQPIIYQCKEVNCNEKEKINKLEEVILRSELNSDKILDFDISDLGYTLKNEKLFIGFRIISPKAAFKSIKPQDVENKKCFIKNEQAPKYSLFILCPKITLTIQ